jgi:hypothetical protein
MEAWRQKRRMSSIEDPSNRTTEAYNSLVASSFASGLLHETRLQQRRNDLGISSPGQRTKPHQEVKVLTFNSDQ